LTTEGWNVRLVDMIRIPAWKLCAARKDLYRLRAEAVRRNKSKPRPAAKSPLLDAIARAAVKRARAWSDATQSISGKAVKRFSTGFRTLCTGHWRQKKNFPGRRSAQPSM
jgi:hypothetical protein